MNTKVLRTTTLLDMMLATDARAKYFLDLCAEDDPVVTPLLKSQID